MADPDSDDGRSWIGPVFAWLYFLTIMKGIRMPNRWSVTHYLFTYQTGFMKRALWGEALRRIFGGWTANYFCLAAVCLVVFVAFVWLVWRACRRLAVTADTVPFLLVFGASPALAYSAHMVGYLEQIGYLALMVALALRRQWRRQAAFSIAAAALLPLIHEASLLWVGALIGLVLLAGTANLRDRLRALAIVGAVWVLSTVCVLWLGGVSRQRLEAVRADRTSFFEFRPRQDAFQTLRIPLRDSMNDMQLRWADPEVRIDMVFSILVFAPAAIFLGRIAVRRARALDGGHAVQVAAVILSVAAIVAPLILHVVAWDRHRWNGLAGLNAGLAALILLAASGPEREPRHPQAGLGLAVALVVALWSISSDPVFFDRYGPRHPPFTWHVQFLIEAIRHPSRDLWIPVE